MKLPEAQQQPQKQIRSNSLSVTVSGEQKSISKIKQQKIAKTEFFFLLVNKV